MQRVINILVKYSGCVRPPRAWSGKAGKEVNATALTAFVEASSANSPPRRVCATRAASPFDPGTLTRDAAALVARDDYPSGANSSSVRRNVTATGRPA